VTISDTVRSSTGRSAGRVTHEVINQVPPLAGHDVAEDQALLGAVERHAAGWVIPELHALGVAAGSAEVIETGQPCPASAWVQT